MSEITLEFIPWLSQQIQPGRTGKLVRQEGIRDSETVRQFLHRLASSDHKVADNVFDLESNDLREHVAVVLNDRMIELVGGLDEPLHEGDTLTLLPTFQGG